MSSERVSSFGGDAAAAKSSKQAYRRRLPHMQLEGQSLYVTFVTKDRWVLPEEVRDLVMRHCLHDHGTRIWLHGAVVMPDHVHLIYAALGDATGKAFPLAQIMQGIKGSSARSVNRLLGRSGELWQAESFDHIIRDKENLEEKVRYLCENPVRKGLVKTAKDYRWIWPERIKGIWPTGCGTAGIPASPGSTG